MRIISGKYKGKRITAPKKLPVRPTTDMAKEGLFNILNNRYYFDGLKILDLFSGTGNISFEFASRGVEEIVAVDANSRCVQFINKTSVALDFDISVVKSDAYKFLQRVKERFDIIFADPPYDFDTDRFFKIVALVFENKLLAEEGVLIIEHAPQTNFESNSRFLESRKYASSVFSFFGE